MSHTTRMREMMLFNYGTTNLTDFRYGQIQPQIKTVHKETPKRPRPPYVPLKYLHTMTSWHTPASFDNYIKPKEIVRTNPWQVQKTYVPPTDEELEEVRRTRPRLVMTPAISIDDIADPEKRGVILKDTYTSDKMRMDQIQQATAAANMCAPLRDRYAPAQPIFLSKWRPHRVEPEWRRDSVSWDRRQLRAYCDPTKEFWLLPEHQPTSCPACEQDKILSEHNDIKCQMLRRKV